MIDPPQLHQHLHHTRLLGSISSALYYGASMPALPAGTTHHNPGRQGAQR